MALKPIPVSEVPKSADAPATADPVAPAAPAPAPVDPAAVDPEQAAREASKTGEHQVVMSMNGIMVGVRTF